MSLSGQVKSLFQAAVESSNQRVAVYPVGAVIAAVSDGVVGAWVWSPYVQIVAAATIPDPCWLAGINISNGVVSDIDADFAIATGAGGAEVDIAIIPVRLLLETSVGQGLAAPIWLPFPIKLVGSPRLAVRVRKDTAASAAGGSLRVAVLTGLGA